MTEEIRPIGDGYQDGYDWIKWCFNCEKHYVFADGVFESYEDCWCQECVRADIASRAAEAAVVYSQMCQDVQAGLCGYGPPEPDNTAG